jgi:hypothetical protein
MGRPRAIATSRTWKFAGFDVSSAFKSNSTIPESGAMPALRRYWKIALQPAVTDLRVTKLDLQEKTGQTVACLCASLY